MSSLDKKGKVSRPRFPGADLPPRFQRGREERFSPPPPPFFPEEFPEGEFPEWHLWLDEGPPPYSPWEQRNPRNFHFPDPWEMEMALFDEWRAFFDRDGEKAFEGRRRGIVPEPNGERGTGNSFSRKNRSARQLESVEKLSPSFDETELLEKIWTRSRSGGKRGKG